MPAIRRRHLLAPLASLFALGACEHGAISETTVPADDGPALILDGSMENLGRVKHMLARSLDRAHIELGADDPTLAPRISVLPPRQGSQVNRSPALPTVFALSLENGKCIATNTQTREDVVLTGIACVPVPPVG